MITKIRIIDENRKVVEKQKAEVKRKKEKPVQIAKELDVVKKVRISRLQKANELVTKKKEDRVKKNSENQIEPTGSNRKLDRRQVFSSLKKKSELENEARRKAKEREKCRKLNKLKSKNANSGRVTAQNNSDKKQLQSIRREEHYRMLMELGETPLRRKNKKKDTVKTEVKQQRKTTKEVGATSTTAKFRENLHDAIKLNKSNERKHIKMMRKIEEERKELQKMSA